jgi:hypothetical protein
LESLQCLRASRDLTRKRLIQPGLDPSDLVAAALEILGDLTPSLLRAAVRGRPHLKFELLQSRLQVREVLT